MPRKASHRQLGTKVGCHLHQRHQLGAHRGAQPALPNQPQRRRPPSQLAAHHPRPRLPTRFYNCAGTTTMARCRLAALAVATVAAALASDQPPAPPSGSVDDAIAVPIEADGVAFTVSVPRWRLDSPESLRAVAIEALAAVNVTAPTTADIDGVADMLIARHAAAVPPPASGDADSLVFSFDYDGAPRVAAIPRFLLATPAGVQRVAATLLATLNATAEQLPAVTAAIAAQDAAASRLAVNLVVDGNATEVTVARWHLRTSGGAAAAAAEVLSAVGVVAPTEDDIAAVRQLLEERDREVADRERSRITTAIAAAEAAAAVPPTFAVTVEVTTADARAFTVRVDRRRLVDEEASNAVAMEALSQIGTERPAEADVTALAAALRERAAAAEARLASLQGEWPRSTAVASAGGYTARCTADASWRAAAPSRVAAWPAHRRRPCIRQLRRCHRRLYCRPAA